MRKLFSTISTLLFIPVAQAQQSTDFLFQEPVDLGEGWSGFTDIGLMGDVLLTLVVATVLGAFIAYHPKHKKRADTLEEIEAPQVYIIYAMIGAIVGILVVKYGLIVGVRFIWHWGVDSLSHGAPVNSPYRSIDFCHLDRLIVRSEPAPCCGAGHHLWLCFDIHSRCTGNLPARC